MDAVSNYSFASCGWHLLQASVLLLWPQAIAGLLTLDMAGAAAVHPSDFVALYFARSLGLAQVALGLVTVVLTGALPLTSLADAPEDQPSPYAPAVLVITTLYHGSTAFYCWARYSGTAQTGFVLGFVGNAVLASFGLWCVLFGGEKARVSRRTGADKRTSGWPFRNAEADRRRGKGAGEKKGL